MKRLLAAIAETIAATDPQIQQIDLFFNQLKKNNNYPIQSEFAFIDIKTTSSQDMGGGRREVTGIVTVRVGKTLIESTEYGIQGTGAGVDIIEEFEAIQDAILKMKHGFISRILDNGFQFEDRYGTTAVYEMRFEITFWKGV